MEKSYFFPFFASLLLENGEIDLGLILDYRKTDNDLFFKTFLLNPIKRKPDSIKISYEENFKSELRTQKKTINGTDFQILELKPQNILRIYNEEVRINVKKEVTVLISSCSKTFFKLSYEMKKEIIQLLKQEKSDIFEKENDRYSLAFSVAKRTKNDSLIQMQNSIKAERLKLTKSPCYKCEEKQFHWNKINRFKSLK